MGLEPKSGCRNCRNESMRLMYVCELGLSAACETSWFHGLSAGNTGQPTIVVAEVAGRAVGCGVGRGVGGSVATAVGATVAGTVGTGVLGATGSDGLTPAAVSGDDLATSATWPAAAHDVTASTAKPAIRRPINASRRWCADTTA